MALKKAKVVEIVSKVGTDTDSRPVSEDWVGDKTRLASFFDVTPPTITDWINKGMPVLQAGAKGRSWKFDIRACAAWRYGGEVQVSQKSDKPIAANVVDPEQLTIVDRKTYFEGELKRRQLQQIDRDLIPAEEFELVLAEMQKTVLQCLDTLPDVLERDTGLAAAQVQRVIQAVDACRDGIYEQVQGCLQNLPIREKSPAE